MKTITASKNTEPETEVETNLEIYNYMRFRAQREETGFDLKPEFFANNLERGIRHMFGVHVSNEGYVVSDPKNLEVLTEWKAANPSAFAGKTGTRCIACFEDFAEDGLQARGHLCCPCSEDLCRKCLMIHVTRTATQCGDEDCTNWHVHCPTCAGQQTYSQGFFHHSHQMSVTNHWLG